MACKVKMAVCLLLSFFARVCFGHSNVIEAAVLNENGEIYSVVNEEQNLVSEKKLGTILDTLKLLRKDVLNMKKKLKFIDTRLFEERKEKKCSQDETKDYIIHHCGNNTQSAKEKYILDGDVQKPVDTDDFCRVVLPNKVSSPSYKVSVMLYNAIGPQGINSGTLGLAYNVDSQYNFDFIVIRLHRYDVCHRSGYVQNGKVVNLMSESGACPAGPPNGREWFKLEVVVHESEAYVYLNGVQISRVAPHFPVYGRGGVILKNGPRSVVHFKQFSISPVDNSAFKFITCKSTTLIGSNYYLLEGKTGQWPHGGFCRAVAKKSSNEQNYAITLSIYNQARTRSDGVFGVMFNVQNNYNFDFVYFKPKSYGGCYTTGFVQNSQIQWTTNSKVGSCPGGPLQNNQWINITVSVRGQAVIVETDKTHIASATTHFPPNGRGGVLVSNTRRNVVAFRKYDVRPIEPAKYKFRKCGTATKSIGDYVILDAQHGKWPESTFCQAISKESLAVKNYLVSVDLFSQGPAQAQGTDYMGLMFNVKDENNYDFVYLSPNDYKNCFKFGFVLNGDIQWSSVTGGLCEGAQISRGKWVELELAVNSESVMISAEGKHLSTFKTHFPGNGRAGVIVGNGQSNILSFREFLLLESTPLPFTFQSCGEGTYRNNQSFILDASWSRHRSKFCLAFARDSITNSTSYEVSAVVYNVDSWQGGDWGSFGLIYNVQDEENFDFLLLNLQNYEECFEYGSIISGNTRYNREYAGRCAVSPPEHKWFKLSLLISRNRSEVTVLIDNKKTAAISSRIPFTAKGGVLVRNGYKNIVMFKNFFILNRSREE